VQAIDSAATDIFRRLTGHYCCDVQYDT